MSECLHHNICGLSDEADPEAQLCILHSKHPDKNIQAFSEALEAHRKSKGNIFRRMIFPKQNGSDGTAWSGMFTFNGATFEGMADFRYAMFYGIINFNGTIFSETASFGEAIFSETASFYGAKFSGQAYFERTKFYGKASFHEATFCEQALFPGAIFCEQDSFDQADFSNATFSKPVSFNDATFSKTVHFSEVRFCDQASFDTARFVEEAHFHEAKLSGHTSFHWAKFCDQVSFRDATFRKPVSFNRATFFKSAHFYEAKFFDRVSFQVATFSGTAYFQEARLSGVADFVLATFSGAVDFSRATFFEEVLFALTWFSKEVEINFNSSQFRGRTIFVPQRNYQENALEGSDQQTIAISADAQRVDFRWVVIDPPDVLTFSGVDLRRWRFLGTDLRKIHFVGVTWPEVGRNFDEVPDHLQQTETPLCLMGRMIRLCQLMRQVCRRKRYGVYDEIALLISGEPSPPLDHIERLYRQLKQNYEDQRDYERAGDFHYGEKEMRRQNRNGTPWALRRLLWLYKVVSGYGERALPPLIWAGLVLLLFAGLYMWFELSPTPPNPNKVPPLALTDTKTWFPAIVYSLQIMTWQKPQLYTLSDSWPIILYTIQSLLGPLLFGLFALAIRQRMKR